LDPTYLMFIVAVFVTVVLLLEGIYTWWRASRGEEARRLARRLKAASVGGSGAHERVSILKEHVLSESPSMQRLLVHTPGVDGLDRLLIHSGLGLTVGKFCSRVAFAALGALMIAVVLRLGPVPTVLLTCAAAVLPLLHVLHARNRRLRRIEEQLPDAVDLIGRALRAGHAFPQSLKMVGDEMRDPIAGEFRYLFDQVNYGTSMQDALIRLTTRVPSMDLKYFVIAVLIQRETGGNLAELLDNIASIIRARLKLLGTIRVLSAEGRLSAWILSLLPFGAALVIQLVNPGFLRVLWTDPAGLKVVGGALFMMGMGILVMRRIIRIRV
jgi:tight adherence protein B